MKKLFSSFLCFAFVVGAFAQANIQMRVVPKIITPGEEVTIDFELINPDQEVSAGNMNIYFPEGIAVKSKSSGYYISMNKKRMQYDEWDETYSHTIQGAYQSDGSFKILFKSDNNDNLKGTSGTLFSLLCTVSSEVSTGLLPLNLKDIVLTWGETAADRFDQEESKGYVRVNGNETVELTIPEGGVATLCLPFAADLKEGLKAYSATGTNGSTVVLSELSSIPATTPVIITGAAGTYTFTGDNSGATATEYTSGVLKGFLVETEAASGYVLQKQASGLGFYNLTSAKAIPAYRCVLQPSSSSAAPAVCYSIGAGENGTTGLDEISEEPGISKVYTLDGKETNSLTKGGLYVINGTKVIIK